MQNIRSFSFFSIFLLLLLYHTDSLLKPYNINLLDKIYYLVPYALIIDFFISCAFCYFCLSGSFSTIRGSYILHKPISERFHKNFPKNTNIRIFEKHTKKTLIHTFIFSGLMILFPLIKNHKLNISDIFWLYFSLPFYFFTLYIIPFLELIKDKEKIYSIKNDGIIVIWLFLSFLLFVSVIMFYSWFYLSSIDKPSSVHIFFIFVFFCTFMEHIYYFVSLDAYKSAIDDKNFV